MISSEDYDIIYEAFCYYRDYLTGNTFEYTYRDRHTKKLHSFSLTFTKANFLHLCGVNYKRRASQFYKDVESNVISFRDISYKKDGTSELKLRTLPNLHMLFSPGVRVTDSGSFFFLKFDKALRTGKNICALSCVSTNNRSEFAPQSLLDLQVNRNKKQAKSLNQSHAVEKLTVKNINTKIERVIFPTN